MNQKLVLFFLIGLMACRSSNDESIIRKHPSAIDIKPSSVKFFKEVLPNLAKKKILLVTNPSGIGNNPERLMQTFSENEIRLQYLIGLEHGFLGLDEDFSSTPVTIL